MLGSENDLNNAATPLRSISRRYCYTSKDGWVEVDYYPARLGATCECYYCTPFKKSESEAEDYYILSDDSSFDDELIAQLDRDKRDRVTASTRYGHYYFGGNYSQ